MNALRPARGWALSAMCAGGHQSCHSYYRRVAFLPGTRSLRARNFTGGSAHARACSRGPEGTGAFELLFAETGDDSLAQRMMTVTRRLRNWRGTVA